jgi:hypothetical protein
MNIWIVSSVWMLVRLQVWFLSFTPSERVALASAFLVFWGVAGEYVIEFKPLVDIAWLKDRIKHFSMAILVLGLAGDVLGIVMSQAEMQVLVRQTGDAATNAQSALTDAGTAKTIAKDASDTAGTANKVAGEAKDKADAAGLSSDTAKRKALEASSEATDAENRALVVKAYTDSIVASVNARRLDRKQFLSILKDKPKGTAEIWYEPDDFEAKEYAEQIADLLGPNGAGWEVASPQVLPRKELPYTYKDETPLLDKLRMDAAENLGLSIAGGRFPSREDPTGGLWTYLGQATASIEGVGVLHFGGMHFLNPPGVPDTHFTIVVGRHKVDVLRMTAPWQQPNANSKRK